MIIHSQMCRKRMGEGGGGGRGLERGREGGGGGEREQEGKGSRRGGVLIESRKCWLGHTHITIPKFEW